MLINSSISKLFVVGYGNAEGWKKKLVSVTLQGAAQSWK